MSELGKDKKNVLRRAGEWIGGITTATALTLGVSACGNNVVAAPQPHETPTSPATSAPQVPGESSPVPSESASVDTKTTNPAPSETLEAPKTAEEIISEYSFEKGLSDQEFADKFVDALEAWTKAGATQENYDKLFSANLGRDEIDAGIKELAAENAVVFSEALFGPTDQISNDAEVAQAQFIKQMTYENYAYIWVKFANIRSELGVQYETSFSDATVIKAENGTVGRLIQLTWIVGNNLLKVEFDKGVEKPPTEEKELVVATNVNKLPEKEVIIAPDTVAFWRN